MRRLFLFCLTVACATAQERVPVELIGSWGYTETRAITYQNRSTGAFAHPSGSTETLQIFPDGTFKTSALIQQSMYSCASKIFITVIGHIVFEGQGVELRYEGGHVSSKDDCNARFNYEKGITPEVKKYDAWTIRSSANGPQLLLASGGHLKFIYTKQH